MASHGATHACLSWLLLSLLVPCMKPDDLVCFSKSGGLASYTELVIALWDEIFPPFSMYFLKLKAALETPLETLK